MQRTNMFMVFFIAALTGPLRLDAAQPYFSGKTITLQVGAPAGGSVCPEVEARPTSEMRQKKKLVFETLQEIELNKDILALRSSEVKVPGF